MTTARQPLQSPKLLLIDDSPLIHALVKGVFRSENIQVISAMDGEQALELARREKPDLILVDYEMPGDNGLEVLRKLRADSESSSIPVVFVTGNDCHQVLTACFKAGASDYIRKPFFGPELSARVGSLLERQHILRKLEHLALYDTLTGLPNRALIRSRIQAAIEHGQSSNCAVLFLDYDRFKLVNDSLGHDAGDELLQQIARRLRSSLRGGDGIAYYSDRTSTARLGGDEFVVLLEDLTDPQDALSVANRLLNALADPYCLCGHTVYCTASIGIVTDAQNYATPDEVLRDADLAMYEAKAAGKARSVLFNLAMRTNIENRLRIESELRIAIADEQLLLVYQPIVSLQTGRPVAFEALVRWKHPQRGLIMPGDFLPVAEETGLIVPLGTWAIDRACREFASWRNLPGTVAPSAIHVNLARQQLLPGDLVDIVTTALDKHGLPPECLHLEVTETEIMQDPTAAKATLTQLRGLGVKIDMDDFGTGHSSLACLQELPIDVLKIDRTFVANMERNRSFAALVHAVTTLGQNLGLTVVAEGIETANQLAMLQSMDCELGQGYFFAKPLSNVAVIDYLCSLSETARKLHAASLPERTEAVSAAIELVR